MKDLWDICRQCLKCCLHGSPFILPHERELILQKTNQDFFISEHGGKSFSIGLPDKKEPCPYLLEDGRCSLHDLGCKPVDCRAWPVGLMPEGELIIDIDCPAAEFLSEEDFSEARKILEKALNTTELREFYYQPIKAGEWKVKRIKSG